MTGNAVNVWPTDSAWSPRRLAQSNTSLVWADTMALDGEGGLWLTTRGWPLDSQPRIVSIFTGDVDNKAWDNC